MDIVMISGKQGSGKTTLQQLLGKIWHDRFGARVTIINFADVLYEMHDACLGILNRYWPRRNLAKDGPLMQVLGTDWARKTIDQDIWVKILQKKIEEAPEGLVIVGDCRFENEFDAIPQALRVRLNAPESVRKPRCAMWRENTTHLSEVGLDLYALEGRFDFTFDTEKLVAMECAKEIEAAMCARQWTAQRKDLKVLNATRQLNNMVEDVNEALRTIEDVTNCRANFRWLYDPQTGRKYLTLADVGVYTPPADRVIAEAKATVPDAMKQAEELVGKPMQVMENEQPQAQ